MSIKLEDTLNTPPTGSTDLLSPTDIIDAMIELRIQLREIEEQIQSLQPAFFTACLALNRLVRKLQSQTVQSFEAKL